MPENILELKNVVYSFKTYGGNVKAVRDVSFEVRKGEILGIVGESGCGKSVTAQCIMRLNPEPPGFFEGGEILYKGQDVLKMNKKELRTFRGREIGFVFQDPMTSLNPTMRIGKQIEEVFRGHKEISKKERKQKALEILRLVGISDPEIRYRKYPHELSGGMKQRVMIAIALVSQPSVIICDEPTTSLDVTIEAQILELLLELRDKLGTSIIMITHDLGVIAKICDRVVVMYGGKIWILKRKRSLNPSKARRRICFLRRSDARSRPAASIAWTSAMRCPRQSIILTRSTGRPAGCSILRHRKQSSSVRSSKRKEGKNDYGVRSYPGAAGPREPSEQILPRGT